MLAFVSSGVVDEPLSELYAFGRLAALAPGETRTLEFFGDLGVLASGRTPPGSPFEARAGAQFLYPGTYEVTVGDTRASGNYVSAPLHVRGSAPAQLSPKAGTVM